MQALALLVDEALQAIHEKDYLKLSQLMDQNFALRRQMYGDDVIGQANLKAISIANKFNLSAKFTGSGGAIVCLNRSAEGDWYCYIVVIYQKIFYCYFCVQAF
jgi:glucuronokinase